MPARTAASIPTCGTCRDSLTGAPAQLRPISTARKAICLSGAGALACATASSASATWAPSRRSLVRAGFPTAVCDLDRAEAEPLLAAGAAWAATPLELARQVDAVITCLPSPKATAAVLDGCWPGCRPGATWIEMSTNGPEEIARFAALAAEHGDRHAGGPGHRRRAPGGGRRDHRPGRRRRGAVPDPRAGAAGDGRRDHLHGAAWARPR